MFSKDDLARIGVGITLANGVKVPAHERIKAAALVSHLTTYAEKYLGEQLGQDSGIVWDLVGYVHGHDKELDPKWHYLLKALDIMDQDGTIPTMRQWAMVSLCCQGNKLGAYASKKERPT